VPDSISTTDVVVFTGDRCCGDHDGCHDAWCHGDDGCGRPAAAGDGAAAAGDDAGMGYDDGSAVGCGDAGMGYDDAVVAVVLS